MESLKLCNNGTAAETLFKTCWDGISSTFLRVEKESGDLMGHRNRIWEETSFKKSMSAHTEKENLSVL